MPSHLALGKKVAKIPQKYGAYSSGNCSGFSPDSLLVRCGTNFKAKIIEKNWVN